MSETLVKRPPGLTGSRLGRRARSLGGLLASVALTFLGLLCITFVIGRIIPIDPALAIVGDRAPAHVYERVREELGLNLPIWQQFFIYVGQVLRGDFGTSILTGRPVMDCCCNCGWKLRTCKRSWRTCRARTPQQHGLHASGSKWRKA